MPKPPERYKNPADYTVDEIVRAMAAKRSGEDFRPETVEYRRHRADALRAAGLVGEADASEPDREPSLEEMTPQQHFDRLRRR